MARTSQHPGAAPAVRLTAVHKAYTEAAARRAVLAGLDLAVAPGRCLALVGPSGSGKSTLLNVIAGLDPPDSGRIEVAGCDLTAMTERDRTLFRRHRIGLVFQFFNLIPTLTVAENVRFPLELCGRSAPEAERRTHVLLARVGLADRGSSLPEQLSGGEQQRVAVIRAVVHQPALVLADEPTGNLDAATGDDVVSLLLDMVRESGTTLVLATHSDVLAARADDVAALRAGRLVAAAEG